MLTDQKRIPRYLIASITCLLIMISFIPSLPYVKAHSGLFLYGYTDTAPTIDGNVNIGGGEWSDADTATFGPLGVGIQTITGTLYMMNNDTYLFIAVIINGDDDFDSYDGMQIDFDNDNGGGTNRAVGDDTLEVYGQSTFYDLYWYGTGNAFDTTDGVGAGSRQGSSNHFECCHPLDSTDDAHDFSLSAGDTVGFQFGAAVDAMILILSAWDLGEYTNPSTYADYIVAGKPTLSSAAGTPTIDGSMGTGEWDAADSVDLVLLDISLNRIARGTVYVMNDATNLYLLVVIEDEYHSSDHIRINFDNDNGGGLNPSTGDDGFEYSSSFYDLYFSSAYYLDTTDSGTNDGEGAGNHAMDKWYFEFSHPLDTLDDSHDFSLSIGNTVGFGISYYDDTTYCNWPLYGNSPDNYAEITVASPRFVGMLNFDDYANRMGSMPGVTPASTIYFPHFHRDSSWQTFYAIVNPGTSSASIDVYYYASDGTTIDTESFSLDAGHKTGMFSASGTGWIKVVSSVPVVGMLNFDDYANRMGSMTGVEPSTILYFPHFHQDLSWQTFFALVNPQGSSASIDVTYYASDGSTISTESFSLDAGHKTGKFPPSGSGWIKVVSSQPIVGMLNFDDYANRMGSMPGVTPSDALYFPHFDQGPSWQTFYALVNPQTTSADIDATYYASDGSTISTESFRLDAGYKTGKFPASGNGWIKVESTQPIVGMLNFDDYSNRMGSMPGATSSYAICYPHFHQDSNWQTYYAIVNSGPDCGLTSAYYASDGSSTGSTSMSLPENNKAGTFPSSGSGWINAPP